MGAKSALIVDDSKSARVMLGRLLKKVGIEYSFTESGEEAIESLNHEDTPDLIFMDHMMPGMDGLEATRLIKNHPKYARIPIIMYTSQDNPEYHQQAITHGAFGVIIKPARLPRLTSILDEIEKEQQNLLPIDADIAQLSAEPMIEDKLPLSLDQLKEQMEEQIEELVERLVSNNFYFLTKKLSPQLTQEVQETLLPLIEKGKADVADEIAEIHSKLEGFQSQGQLTDIKSEVCQLRTDLESVEQLAVNNPHNVTAIKQELNDALHNISYELNAEIERRLKPLVNAVELHHKLLSSETEESFNWRDDFLNTIMPALSNHVKAEITDTLQTELSLAKKQVKELNKNKKMLQVMMMLSGISITILGAAVSFLVWVN